MNSDHNKQKFEFLDRVLAEHIKHEKKASAPNRPCPDENTFGAFLENTLPDKEKIEFETHLAVCTACQTQMAGVLKILAVESAEINPAQKSTSRRWLGIIPYGLLGELRFAHAFAALIIVSVLIYGGNRLIKVTHTEQGPAFQRLESQPTTDAKKKSEPEALKQATVSEEKKDMDRRADRAPEVQTPPVQEARTRAGASLKRKQTQESDPSYADLSSAIKKEAGRGAARNEAAKVEAESASRVFSLQPGAIAPKPAPSPPAAAMERHEEAQLDVASQPPTGYVAGSRAKAPPSASAGPTDKIADAGANVAPKKSAGRAKPVSREGTLSTTEFTGQGLTITYINSPLREGDTNLEMQIAQRLNALGIPRDRKELVPQTRSAKLNLQQDALSRKRALVDASGATKEFYFVDGIWVDKEILQSQSPAAIWIKLDSPEYRKLVGDQETVQDAAIENEESKKRLEDQRNLKKYFALGERVLIVQKNQIYYLMK
jgi:hypothetical protein